MEALKRKQFNRYIEHFEFDHLFNQLGWNYVDKAFPKKAAGHTFQFRQIAEKEGFAILICEPAPEGNIPDAQTRKRIHTEISKLHHEHLIIFIDQARNTQQWELLVREPNKPARVVGHKWSKGQAPELLYQKLSGAFFTLEEDESGSLTIVDVVDRMRKNFGANAEKVTKKFYAEFKKQHSQFLDFIQGIDDAIPIKENTNKQWYASLMLNRLMFCYFIQKKGFLDQDRNYLKNKLKACQELAGQGKFYGFYRSFLLELFHDGLGQPIDKRSDGLPVELGRIPYLNGGLFDVHELERQFDAIQIDDVAFEKVFKFFDEWEWHLDTREHAEGKTINPDVIGYIFEKYINDRAAMGAYYTKEDITDYIGKNTIIPFLFDETERHYKEGFKPESELWNTLKTSGDTYIYDAVKYGASKEGGLFDDLPADVQTGFQPSLEKQVVKADTSPHLWEIRKPWNQRAPQDIGLPTEIYRELIERRRRYAEVKSKIEGGAITHINDFITYNLNIRQFAQDFIETAQDPAFIRHFYKALTKVAILDPTCGSGAFLFAALNILEPLYETCLKRMEEFTEEQPGKHRFFEETLEWVNNEEHPSLQYFIYKSIILNNLYGVDIMKEAVEIAKLRLFLKLVATVDLDPGKKNFGLEPLPDIDFNIRAGNSLVGFATEKELLETIQRKDALFAPAKLDEFKEEFELVSKAYSHFQNSQLVSDQGSNSFREAKAELNRRLKALNHKLNTYLATNYGIEADRKPSEYKAWLDSHQPFHWFAEFYRIIANEGGFDVIIGNPPYVRYSPSFEYNLINYETIKTGDLYSYVIERCTSIVRDQGHFGYIIPLSSFSTEGFQPFQELIRSRSSFLQIANFDKRPGKLFDVEQRVTIVLGVSSSQKETLINSTKLMKWYSIQRDTLFENLNYSELENIHLLGGSFLKLGTVNEKRIASKLLAQSVLGKSTVKNGNAFYYKRRSGYFLAIFDFIPKMMTEKGEKLISSELKSVYLESEEYRDSLCAALNSTLFWWYFVVTSDFRHVNSREVFGFNLDVDRLPNILIKALCELNKVLMIDLEHNSIIQINYYPKYGNTSIQTFYHNKSKPIIDQIDTVLARHYGFTEEELDFIINYDIKYRMGKALFGEEDEGEDENDD